MINKKDFEKMLEYNIPTRSGHWQLFAKNLCRTRSELTGSRLLFTTVADVGDY